MLTVQTYGNLSNSPSHGGASSHQAYEIALLILAKKNPRFPLSRATIVLRMDDIRLHQRFPGLLIFNPTSNYIRRHHGIHTLIPIYFGEAAAAATATTTTRESGALIPCIIEVVARRD